MKTKVLFLGSHLKSYHCFRYLVENFPTVEIVGVVPHCQQPPIRFDQNIVTYAKTKQIPILKLTDLTQIRCDLGISLMFDAKLPPEIVAIAKRGFVNIHLAPLPRLRGCNGIFHAIRLAREKNCWQYAVTLHYMDARLDTGPIIDRVDLPLFEDDTAQSLHIRACDKVYELFVGNIGRLVKNQTRLKSKPQKGIGTYYFKKDIVHEIDINWPPEKIYDYVRALTFPGKPKPFISVGPYRFYVSLENI